MIRIDHRLARLAAQITTELPRQLPHPLHRATAGARRGLFAGEQGQAVMQVGVAATQDVTLAEQRGEIAGHGAEAEGMATQQ
ncbi:hypothetical protein D3C80_1507100 [compost metagenome]